jgi:hypothetical protein
MALELHASIPRRFVQITSATLCAAAVSHQVESLLKILVHSAKQRLAEPIQAFRQIEKDGFPFTLPGVYT